MGVTPSVSFADTSPVNGGGKKRYNFARNNSTTRNRASGNCLSETCRMRVSRKCPVVVSASIACSSVASLDAPRRKGGSGNSLSLYGAPASSDTAQAERGET